MKKYCILLCFIFAIGGKCIAQEPVEPVVSPEEAKVLQLAADEVEDREAAYKEIIKNPRLYLKYLRLAAKSEDPELQRHGGDLLFFGEVGINESMKAKLIDSVVKLKDAHQSEQKDMMSDLLTEYTENRSLTEDEYMVLINMYKLCPASASNRSLFCFILQQASQGFKLPRISDKDPLKYVDYLIGKSPRLYEFNKVVGCLYGIQRVAFKSSTANHLVKSWRDLLLDPVAYEGKIRGRNTNSTIENTLDIALYRTDQLPRIFSEQISDEMSPVRNIAYEWMHLSQMGKNPDRNEYLGKMLTLYYGLKRRPEDAIVIGESASKLLGGVDDVEAVKKYVQWSPDVDPNDYLIFAGYPTLECIKAHAQKSIDRMKKDPKNQLGELFYFTDIFSILEGPREFEMIQELCTEVFPLLGVETLNEFLERTSLIDRSALSPTLQCEFVEYSPGLADLLMNQEGVYSCFFDEEGHYKELLLRLFEGLSPREQHQMFLVTQRKITYWEGFLEKNIHALIAKLKAGTSYDADDLCLLSEYLYLTGWEDLAFTLMVETKDAAFYSHPMTLYYTVLKLIEKGDTAAAESFLNRCNKEVCSLDASYYLAASEIAKAKKDSAKAKQYLTYAQTLYLLDAEGGRGDEGVFIANLLRGSYLQEAERMQQISVFSLSGLDNYARMGEIYLKAGDWHKARFYFECERYVSLVREDISHTIPLMVYLIKSELAQAMLYMSQGEQDKAKPHLDFCLKKLVSNPEMAEEVMGILCGPSAVATSEQKKQWRDQMLCSYQELQTKYPRDASTPQAIQYLQALEPKTVSSVMVKHAETDRSWRQAEPVRSWTYRGEPFDGSLCFRTPNSVEIRRASDGSMDTYFFNKLSEEDVAYVKAWDPDKKIKEEYAKLCAQNPEGITWLRDAVFGTQLAEVQKKVCIIVYLPSEDTAVYKHYYQMLTGKGLRDLLGQDVICVLLTPRADGEWSPTNAHLLTQAAAMGKVNMAQPMIQCIQATKTSVIALPVQDCKEEDFLKLLSAELPKK